MPYLTGQQTPAVMSILGSLRGSRGPTRRRKRTKSSASKRRGAKRRRNNKLKKLVKGSAAAKAHMARLRRMRRK